MPKATSTNRRRVEREGGYYSMVPEWLIDSEISDRALRLWAVLDRYAGSSGECFPSRATLARRLRKSDDTVDRAIAELVEIGALEVEREQGRVHVYRLLSRPRTGRRSAETTLRTDAETTLRTDAAQNERQGNERETTTDVVASSARGPVGPVWRVDRKPVTLVEERFAREVLAYWNEAAGTNLQSRDWLAKIVMRIRERPDGTLDDHRRVIDAALANPWWRGPATPSVVYGNGAQFERSIETARGARSVEEILAAEARS